MSNTKTNQSGSTVNSIKIYDYDKLFYKINSYLINNPTNTFKTIEIIYQNLKRDYYEISVEAEEMFLNEINLVYDLDITNITYQETEDVLFEQMLSKLIDFNLDNIIKLPRIYVEKNYLKKNKCKECNCIIKSNEMCTQHHKYEIGEFDILFQSINDFTIYGFVEYTKDPNKITIIQIQKDQLYTFEIKRTMSLQVIAKQCERMYLYWNDVLEKYLINESTWYCLFFYNNKYEFDSNILLLISFLNNTKDKENIDDECSNIRRYFEEEDIRLTKSTETINRNWSYWKKSIVFVKELIAKKDLQPISLYYYEGKIVLNHITNTYLRDLQNTQRRLYIIQERLQDIQVDVLQNNQGRLQNIQIDLQNTQLDLQITQVDLQNIEGRLQNTQGDLQITQIDLQNTEGRLQNTQRDLQIIKRDLDYTEGRLQNTQRDLQIIKRDLDYTEERFQNTQIDLYNTHRDLNYIEGRLQNTLIDLHINQNDLHKIKGRLHKIKEDLLNLNREVDINRKEIEKLKNIMLIHHQVDFFHNILRFIYDIVIQNKILIGVIFICFAIAYLKKNYFNQI